jgi:Mg-chelatase subunit ChlD
MAFLSPWFLGAGAALVAIPILIHLLNRRRFKVVKWAAMEYLLAAMRKNRRRLKFEQWLLLATRCAVLLLLGLALARPLECSNHALASVAAQRNGLHILVIDNSYSMAYEADRGGTAKTHFDQAKIIARALADRIISGGESVAIVTAGHPAVAVIAKPTYELDAAHIAIDGIEQSYAGTDLPEALDKAVQIARDETHQPSKTLYVITDGTRSSMEGSQADALKNAAQQVSAEFGDADHVQIFDLGRTDQWNQAVLAIAPQENLITTKSSADFAAVARSFGNRADTGIQWQIDDRTVGGSQLKLSETSDPLLLNNQLIRTNGPHVITASLLSDDRLHLDDSRSHVVNAASEVPVLVVAGERSSKTDSSVFVENAISPPAAAANIGGAKTNSALVAHVIGDQDLSDRQALTDYRAVLLVNVGHISDSVADQLEKYVENGGVVVLFMGPKVDGDDYNRVLLNNKHHLLPGKLVERMSTATAGVDAFHFDFHPDGNLPVYLRIFQGNANSGLGTWSISQYWRLSITDPSTQRVLDYVSTARHSTSGTQPAPDPAITVHGVGKGHVVFFSTAGDPQWSGLPGHPNFLPLIQELITNTTDPGDGWMNLTVGQSLQTPIEVQFNGQPTLIDTGQHEMPVISVQNADGITFYRSSPLKKPGVYHLRTATQIFPIAVNVPPDEADVRTLSPDAIRKAFADIPLTLQGDQLPAMEAVGLQEGRDFGWTIMTIVLAAAAFECFLAMKFGHYRRVASAPTTGSVA